MTTTQQETLRISNPKWCNLGDRWARAHSDVERVMKMHSGRCPAAGQPGCKRDRAFSTSRHVTHVGGGLSNPGLGEQLDAIASCAARSLMATPVGSIPAPGTGGSRPACKRSPRIDVVATRERAVNSATNILGTGGDPLVGAAFNTHDLCPLRDGDRPSFLGLLAHQVCANNKGRSHSQRARFCVRVSHSKTRREKNACIQRSASSGCPSDDRTETTLSPKRRSCLRTRSRQRCITGYANGCYVLVDLSCFGDFNHAVPSSLLGRTESVPLSMGGHRGPLARWVQEQGRSPHFIGNDGGSSLCAHLHPKASANPRSSACRYAQRWVRSLMPRRALTRSFPFRSGAAGCFFGSVAEVDVSSRPKAVPLSTTAVDLAKASRVLLLMSQELKESSGSGSSPSARLLRDGRAQMKGAGANPAGATASSSEARCFGDALGCYLFAERVAGGMGGEVMTLDELLIDSDWCAAFADEGNCSSGNCTKDLEAFGGVSDEPFSRSDVAEILVAVDGENDGPSWVGVFRLKDGRIASVSAGCDYTGWD